jgi:hypothetical protein
MALPPQPSAEDSLVRGIHSGAFRLYTGKETDSMNKLLPKNEHAVERALRVAVGIGLIGAAAMGAVGSWGYIGLMPVLTGLIGSCPLYTVLGISTCPTGNSNREAQATKS